MITCNTYSIQSFFPLITQVFSSLLSTNGRQRVPSNATQKIRSDSFSRSQRASGHRPPGTWIERASKKHHADNTNTTSASRIRTGADGATDWLHARRETASCATFFRAHTPRFNFLRSCTLADKGSEMYYVISEEEFRGVVLAGCSVLWNLSSVLSLDQMQKTCGRMLVIFRNKQF